VPRPDTDVLVIGAGPAGSTVAIRLARQGWRVTLAEQNAFPRQKVCGECLGPASLELLDELGLGSAVREIAGPAIRQVAWMAGSETTVAQMPACRAGRHDYGCAIGRDSLDLLLIDHARATGVELLQPARVRRIDGHPGRFTCWYGRHLEHQLTAALVIDAHGSWERGPEYDLHSPDPRPRPAELLAFKASFSATRLDSGVLPVLCLPGGYGGMVVSDRARTTLACCIRRDRLQRLRSLSPGDAAGDVVEAWLRRSCKGVDTALCRSQRDGAWHAVGPLRTGFHPGSSPGIVRIGNAAVEAHPLIGEGICMALQSAAIFASLAARRAVAIDAASLVALQRTHVALCRQQFAQRLRIAQLYARIAMRPSLAGATARLMRSWPVTLTAGAQMAGKARRAASQPVHQVTV
jgi:menaquinone-9 beta-reductase